MAVEALTSGKEWESCSQFMPETDKVQRVRLKNVLLAHAVAFEHGLIPYSKLLEAVVFPYLKLAQYIKKTTSCSPTASIVAKQEVALDLYDIWACGFLQICKSMSVAKDSDSFQPARTTVLLTSFYEDGVLEVIFV